MRERRREGERRVGERRVGRRWRNVKLWFQSGSADWSVISVPAKQFAMATRSRPPK